MKSDALQNLLNLTQSQNDLQARIAKVRVAGSLLAGTGKHVEQITQGDITEAVKIAWRVWEEVLRHEGSNGQSNKSQTHS